MTQATPDCWTIQDSAKLYGIDRWGDGYFSISPDGNVLVSPDQDPSNSVDLKRLVDSLTDRGLQLPILLRFNGILRQRLQQLQSCFQTAIDSFGYQNRYRCVFPIKVNQQRDVVQQVVTEGSKMGFGIEAGSKPELLAAIAMADANVPIICNGFKDDEFIRLAMLADQFGRTVIPVIEKASELDLILKVAEQTRVRPTFGMRVKLATRGSGRWQASGGYRSKFGLTVAEVVSALDRLVAIGMTDCFQLLHFHVGSQIGNIRQLKSAILEAARIYVDLRRRGADLNYLDVGGGLGVDYDGSRTDTDSSMNYSMQEYANDVVYHVQSICDQTGVAHPQLLSESGRAVAAQHSLLVMETLGVTQQGEQEIPIVSDATRADAAADNRPGTPMTQPLPENYEQPVKDLWLGYNELDSTNMLETLHDAQVSLDLCMNLFSGGYLQLEQRVAAENLYFALCNRIRGLAKERSGGDRGHVPPEIQQLDRMLSDIYFVNFSLFQSMPDAWAIDQLFPIMPIHRLDERPTRHAVIGDITCDSDGKVDLFVGDGQPTPTLQLHPVQSGQPYLLAVFMVGAYQEILGDLHNLFGDTHAVHVECDGGVPKIRSVVKGDTVSEVLGYVQYEERELMEKVQDSVEEAITRGLINHQQAGQTIAAFEKTLGGYTYLSSPQISADRSPNADKRQRSWDADRVSGTGCV